jgi:hypothetical protein
MSGNTIMKPILLAAAACAALTLALPAQAGEGVSFFFGVGGWRVPSCAAPKVLREVRNAQTGRLVWRCVTPPEKVAQAAPAGR